MTSSNRSILSSMEQLILCLLKVSDADPNTATSVAPAATLNQIENGQYNTHASLIDALSHLTCCSTLFRRNQLGIFHFQIKMHVTKYILKSCPLTH